MVKFIMLLLYIANGRPVLEQKSFNDAAACEAAAKVRVQELVKEPRFDTGLYAACVPAIVDEAKK